ncbi:myb-like protein AA [Sycon ciliatum]|uniref:myb-like protein AA n=1 Tax=Sycon ciliatum TaxID=27933 RepID=UPI0031F6AA09
MGELAGEPAMKLLCSLPGIEQTLLSVLQTLTSHISESRDREGRLHQRVDDLSTQLLALREEFCSLQKSAIVVPDKAPARSTQHQIQGDKSRTRTKPRNRPPQQGQPDPAAAANQLDPADADAGQQSGQIDVASGSAQHETRTRTDDPGFVDPEPVQSDCEKSQPIMAVIKDDSWKLVAAGPPRKKRSVFFVGNLSHDCTVDSLTDQQHQHQQEQPPQQEQQQHQQQHQQSPQQHQ